MTEPAHVTLLADAAVRMSSVRSLDETLIAVVETARDIFLGIDHVGVTLLGRNQTWSTSAATDDVVRKLDDLQYSVRQGPCVQTLLDPTAKQIAIHDARHDSRWHDFVPSAARLGLRSLLALKLRAGARTLGCLNLYSTSSDHIGEQTLALAPPFATHASLAIAHASQVENLHRAIESRELIGRAVGLTMLQFKIGSDAAFRYLVRVSATSERKLRDVAADVAARADVSVDEHARLDPDDVRSTSAQARGSTPGSEPGRNRSTTRT